jgi:hypothetical protein
VRDLGPCSAATSRLHFYAFKDKQECVILSKLKTSKQTNNKYTHKRVHLKIKTIYKIPVST